MNAFAALVQRDLRLAMRRKSEVLTALFFFVVVATLFPLGIGPELGVLRKIAPGILWVGALLASLLSLGRLFSADFQDGTLEQMALSATPLPVLVGAKILAHWILSGLPLALLAPVLAFNQPAAARHYAELERHLDSSASGDDQVASNAFIRRMTALVGEMPFDQTLRGNGVPEADLPMLARDAMAVQRLLVNNPREVTYDDALALYQAVY